MPPKKSAGGKKMTSQQKQKLIDDKTFGMKNKKGKKNQQYIAQVAAAVEGRSRRGGASDRRAQKQAEKEEKAMMDNLFKPVRPKLGDLRPKKKKEAKKEEEPDKKDLYTDSRDQKNQESSADWDQATLESVVNQKHGQQKVQTTTSKVCKFFLDAVEKGLYGWFWVCPNGGDACKYRHALPPGYVLKKDRKKKEEEEAKLTLEELIDRERAELATRSDLTPVTPETFAKWKKKKIEAKRKALKASNKKKKKAMQAGKMSQVTGREFFSFRPEVGADDGDDDGDGFDFPAKKKPAQSDTSATTEASTGSTEDKPEPEAFDASVFAAVDMGDLDDIDDDDGDDDDVEGSEDATSSSSKKSGLVDGNDSKGSPNNGKGTSANGSSNTPSSDASNVKVGDVAVDADLFADELDDLDLDDA